MKKMNDFISFYICKKLWSSKRLNNLSHTADKMQGKVYNLDLQNQELVPESL